MMEFIIVALLSSLPAVGVTGQSNVTGSHDPVKVTVGDNAILPCHLEPPLDMTTLTVEWKRDGEYVHVYTSRGDNPRLQDENFRGRTSLFHEEMIRGNISLKLTNVTELDAGSYTCFVPKLQSQVKKDLINLTVEPVKNRNEESQTGDINTESGGDTGFSPGAKIGIVVGVIAAIVVALAVLMNRRKITTDCARPNTTGHNGQNGEGSQEDNAEDNAEDNPGNIAEDNDEDNTEDSDGGNGENIGMLNLRNVN